MKFRVHLIDGSKFDTNETPQAIHEEYLGRVLRIKRIRGEAPAQRAPQAHQSDNVRFANQIVSEWMGLSEDEE